MRKGERRVERCIAEERRRAAENDAARRDATCESSRINRGDCVAVIAQHAITAHTAAPLTQLLSSLLSTLLYSRLAALRSASRLVSSRLLYFSDSRLDATRRNSTQRGHSDSMSRRAARRGAALREARLTRAARIRGHFRESGRERPSLHTRCTLSRPPHSSDAAPFHSTALFSPLSTPLPPSRPPNCLHCLFPDPSGPVQIVDLPVDRH